MDFNILTPNFVSTSILKFASLWNIKDLYSLIKVMEATLSGKTVEETTKEGEFSVKINEFLDSIGYKNKKSVAHELSKLRLGSRVKGSIIQQRSGEDLILLEPNLTPRFSLYAVIDGHGASEKPVTRRVADNFSKLILKQLKKDLGRIGNGNISSKYFTNLFRLLDDSLSTENLEGGSTASIVLIDILNSEAWCVHVGDSPIVIVESGKSKLVYRSTDHAASNLNEASRVEKEGGMIVFDGVHRVTRPGKCDMALMVSRAIGDFCLKPIVSNIPDVKKVKLHPFMKIIMASDGVFEQGDPEWLLNDNLMENQHDYLKLAASKTTDDCSLIVIEV